MNLILDPIAIFVLGWGVAGAAAATVAGQVVTCVLALVYFKKPKTFSFSKNSFRLRGSITAEIIKLGLSSFIIQMAIVIVMTVANNLLVVYGPSSKYGADIPLSVIGIVMKVFAIVISLVVGIAVGGQPIVGYNYGAKNYSRVLETLKRMLAANAVIGIAATILFEACPQIIVNLFGNESELYNEYACLCFRIFLSGILFCCIQKTASIFLQSIGRPVQSTLLSLSRDVIFFVPALLLLTPAFGVTGLLWAAPVSDVLALVVTALLLCAEVKKIKNAG